MLMFCQIFTKCLKFWFSLIPDTGGGVQIATAILFLAVGSFCSFVEFDPIMQAFQLNSLFLHP